MHNNSALCFSLTAALLLTACNPTYLLESKIIANTQAEAPAEIVETASYRSQLAKITTVAVRAPDNCSNQTAAAATGDATAAGTILKTECGVEMAEIERALAKRGLKVISWKILAREMTQSTKSASAVAQAMGAEVLFQINSLEKSVKSLGKDARWERGYYLSNEQGDKLERKELDERTRLYLRNTFLSGQERDAESTGLRVPSVTLDANAVDLATGEAIWYYRWTHADASGINYAYQALVTCKGNDLKCISIPNRSRVKRKDASGLSSADSDAISVAASPMDEEAHKHAELLTHVVNNLVSSFVSKSSALPHAPSP